MDSHNGCGATLRSALSPGEGTSLGVDAILFFSETEQRGERITIQREDTGGKKIVFTDKKESKRRRGEKVTTQREEARRSQVVLIENTITHRRAGLMLITFSFSIRKKKRTEKKE